MNYYANYCCENGTRLKKAIQSKNKAQLYKDIREIAIRNTPIGNCTTWEVVDEKGERVYLEQIDRKGKYFKFIDNYKKRL